MNVVLIVKTDTNLDNEAELVKPISINSHNVSSDSKRNETDHINEVGNISQHQRDTKTAECNSADAPDDELKQQKLKLTALIDATLKTYVFSFQK